MVEKKIKFKDVMWLVQHPRGHAARELWSRIKPLQDNYGTIKLENNSLKRRLNRALKKIDRMESKCVCQ